MDDKKGFRLIDFSEENGYGSANTDFSKGKGTYNPQAQSGDLIKTSFDEPRFSGDKGSLSSISKNDSIDTYSDSSGDGNGGGE